MELSVLEAQQALNSIYSNWELDAAQALLAIEEAEQKLETVPKSDLEKAMSWEALAEAEEAVADAGHLPHVFGRF